MGEVPQVAGEGPLPVERVAGIDRPAGAVPDGGSCHQAVQGQPTPRLMSRSVLTSVHRSSCCRVILPTVVPSPTRARRRADLWSPAACGAAQASPTSPALRRAATLPGRSRLATTLSRSDLAPAPPHPPARRRQPLSVPSLHRDSLPRPPNGRCRPVGPRASIRSHVVLISTIHELNSYYLGQF